MRIMFCDIWDKALPKILELSKRYPNHEYYLCHFGSITEKKKSERVLKKYNITIIDISFRKNGLNYKNFIGKIRPDVIILFTFFHITDYYFLIMAKNENIRTIYLQHGLHVFTKNSIELNSSFLQKIGKYIKYSNRLIYSGFQSKNINTIYKIFSYLFKLPFYIGKTWELKIDNYMPDYYIVYSLFDKNYLYNNFGIKKKKIYISGYFEGINNTTDNAIQINGRYAIYISQPLVEDRIIDYNSYSEIISEINNCCKKFNTKLIIKLHPRENEINYKDNCNKIDDNIIFVKNCNIEELMRGAVVIWGHFSTLLLQAIKQYKPIIIIEPNNISFKVPDIIRNSIYLVSYILKPNEINKIDLTMLDIDKEKYDQIIREYIYDEGTNSYEIIYNVINEMKKKH